MKQRLLRALCVFCALSLTLLSTACAAPPASSLPATPTDADARSGMTHQGRYYRGTDLGKYTQADYDLLLSFKTAEYPTMTVAAFNKAVLDWQDETAYHKTEQALERVFHSLPEEDPNADFIFRTLSTTWRECEKKHYNACAQSTAPMYSGWAKYETYGDVFGDQVTLTGAYLDFDFNYTIPDETALTVAERDQLLQSLETGMQEFLEAQAQAALKNEEAMEKTLLEELKKRLQQLDSRIVWAGEADAGYWWDQSWDEQENPHSGTTVMQSGSASNASDYEHTDRYTKQQYNLALAQLQFEGYETMSVAEFNRRVNAAFDTDGGDEDGLWFAYDMVLSYLPETDPNYNFFHGTIQAAQEEYDARMKEVLQGKREDPQAQGDVSLELHEDVFGDQVVVGAVQASYTFTYQLTDPNTLTVAQRDAFLAAVRQSVKTALNEAVAKDGGSMSERDLKKVVENAGKTASTSAIQYSGCEIDYFEMYR